MPDIRNENLCELSEAYSQHQPMHFGNVQLPVEQVKMLSVFHKYFQELLPNLNKREKTSGANVLSDYLDQANLSFAALKTLCAVV